MVFSPLEETPGCSEHGHNRNCVLPRRHALSTGTTYRTHSMTNEFLPPGRPGDQLHFLFNALQNVRAPKIQNLLGNGVSSNQS